MLKLKKVESQSLTTIIKPPTVVPTPMGKPSVFLAGSIEMGAAEDWQQTFSEKLIQESVECYVLNPRRDNWDRSWKQEIENEKFREQVEWELDCMDKADVIALYFDPETKAPISLLELGLHAHDGKLLVCCPDGYWRKGNVDIVCTKYGIDQLRTLDELMEKVVEELRVLA